MSNCSRCGRKYVGYKVGEARDKGIVRPVKDTECVSMRSHPWWGGPLCNVCLDETPQFMLAWHWAWGRVEWWPRDVKMVRRLHVPVEEIELGSEVWREMNPVHTDLEDEVQIRIRCSHAGHTWEPPVFGQLALAV